MFLISITLSFICFILFYLPNYPIDQKYNHPYTNNKYSRFSSHSFSFSERIKCSYSTLRFPYLSGRGVSLFFRGERRQCPTFCITHSKGGRRASSKLTTKEEWLSTRNFAARLTTSLRRFPADHFFRSEKKRDPPTGHSYICFYKYTDLSIAFTIIRHMFAKKV